MSEFREDDDEDGLCLLLLPLFIIPIMIIAIYSLILKLIKKNDDD